MVKREKKLRPRPTGPCQGFTYGGRAKKQRHLTHTVYKSQNIYECPSPQGTKIGAGNVEKKYVKANADERNATQIESSEGDKNIGKRTRTYRPIHAPLHP